MKTFQVMVSVLAVAFIAAGCGDYNTTYTVAPSKQNESITNLDKKITELQGQLAPTTDSEGAAAEIQILQQRVDDLTKAIEEFQNGNTAKDSGSEGAADATPPSIASMNPSDRSTVDPSLGGVVVTFSEPMEYGSIKAAAGIEYHGGVSLPIDVQCVGTGDENAPGCAGANLVWSDGALLPDTEYQVTIWKTSKDWAGNPMQTTFTSRFTTTHGGGSQ